MTLLTVLAPTAAQQQIPTLWQGSDVRMAVEVAFRSNPLADVLLWEDITDYVREVSITRGRSGELDRFQPSTAAITVASTGRDFDPEYTSGPWYGYVLPNRPIRVRVQYDAGAGLVEYPVWQGFVDEWPQDYTGISAAQVAIPCSDAFAWLIQQATPPTPFEAELLSDLAGDEPPTSWYRLGEATGTVATDRLGGASGTYVSTPTLGATGLPLGSTDTAVTFAATESVRFPSSILTTLPWAVEFVFSGTTWSQNPDGATLFWAMSGSYGYRIYIDDLPTFPGLDLIIVDFEATLGVDQRVAAASILDGSPHHLVAGVAADGQPFLYVDGVRSVTADSWNPLPAPPSVTWELCGKGDTGGTPSTGGQAGTYDEFVVWNGVQPSAARIAARAEAALTGWPAETTAVRAGRVLDVLGWPDTYRDVGTGATTVSAGATNSNGYDQLMTLADTEGGQCYVDGQGRIVFRGRTEMGSDTRSAVSQAVFGDA